MRQSLVMLRRVAFKLTYGYGLIYFPPSTNVLAGTVAHIPQHQGERRFFSDYRRGGGIVFLPDKPEINRDIYFRGAGIFAGQQGRFPALPFSQFLFIHDGAGRADLRAGAAETTAGLRQRKVVLPADVPLAVLRFFDENPHPPQIFTGPDAAPAQNALIGVDGKKRIARIHRKEPGRSLRSVFFLADILLERLQLAVKIFDTGAAVGGVAFQDFFHRCPARRRQFFRLRFYHQARGGGGIAGYNEFIFTFHLYQAQTAFAGGREVRVIA